MSKLPSRNWTAAFSSRNVETKGVELLQLRVRCRHHHPSSLRQREPTAPEPDGGPAGELTVKRARHSGIAASVLSGAPPPLAAAWKRAASPGRVRARAAPALTPNFRCVGEGAAVTRTRRGARARRGRRAATWSVSSPYQWSGANAHVLRHADNNRSVGGETVVPPASTIDSESLCLWHR